MKSALACIVCAALMLLVSSCVPTYEVRDEVIDSLGAYERKELFLHGDFQDFTDYGRYHYTFAQLDGNPYFTVLGDAGAEELIGYVRNFERWVSTLASSAEFDGRDNELVRNYDFDKGCVSPSDFCYVYDKKGEPIGNSAYAKYAHYSVYFFDVETNTLYYFHNNT